MATLSQKARLLTGVLTGSRARNGPFFVSVEATSRCNLTCLGCRHHSPLSTSSPAARQALDRLPLERFTTLVGDLSRMRTRLLVIAGRGEPFLHPQLFAMIRLARGSHLEVAVHTNGTLLAEQECHEVLESGLDTLKVTLWSPSKEAYEVAYPGVSPEKFDKVVNGLERLSALKAQKGKKKPAVVLCVPINRNNVDAVEAMADLAVATACDAVHFSPLTPSRKGGDDPMALDAGEETRLGRSLARLGRRLDSLGMHHNIENVLSRYRLGEAVWRRLPCYVAWYSATIRADGGVFPCCRCATSAGNLADAGFPSIWNNQVFRAFREKTATREGLAAMGDDCFCNFCTFVINNARIHHVCRWLPRYLGHTKSICILDTCFRIPRR